MSPARQPDGSPAKESRPPSFRSSRPSTQTGNPKGVRVVPNKRRYFDPDAFLATIGEGRKSVLFRKKQAIFRARGSR